MQYFVYLLKCRDGTFYCGYSTDLKKRLNAHNEGKGAKYTRGRKPVKLVYSEEFEAKSKALKREKQIKSFSREKKQELVARNSKFDKSFSEKEIKLIDSLIEKELGSVKTLPFKREHKDRKF